MEENGSIYTPMSGNSSTKNFLYSQRKLNLMKCPPWLTDWTMKNKVSLQSYNELLFPGYPIATDSGVTVPLKVYFSHTSNNLCQSGHASDVLCSCKFLSIPTVDKYCNIKIKEHLFFRRQSLGCLLMMSSQI